MTQHFLLSAAARSLSPAKVMRMSDRGVENVFVRVRWPHTDGKPVCPNCGCQICYDCRRSEHQPRWRCKACRADFSVTSGTLFAWHKLPLRTYLLAIAVFCNEVKGKSMLAFSRELDVQYKTAFVLAHKLREAMASSVKALRIGGEGREAEIDGAYFGGHIRPENLAAERIDRRLAENRSDKRQVVVAIRERGGRTLVQVFSCEADAVSTIRQRIARGTTVHADESPAWNPLHASFAMRRINHQDGYSIDGACTNRAESFFSRLRRGELGHHHHIAGPYLVRYAQEAAWREDLSRVSNGEQVDAVVGLAMRCRPSLDFRGYWQRARAA
jgi:transposase-like protein